VAQAELAVDWWHSGCELFHAAAPLHSVQRLVCARLCNTFPPVLVEPAHAAGQGGCCFVLRVVSRDSDVAQAMQNKLDAQEQRLQRLEQLVAGSAGEGQCNSSAL
jgi:hypothetical protein